MGGWTVRHYATDQPHPVGAAPDGMAYGVTGQAFRGPEIVRQQYCSRLSAFANIQVDVRMPMTRTGPLPPNGPVPPIGRTLAHHVSMMAQLGLLGASWDQDTPKGVAVCFHASCANIQPNG
jgi:hypothetical protein